MNLYLLHNVMISKVQSQYEQHGEEKPIKILRCLLLFEENFKIYQKT